MNFFFRAIMSLAAQLWMRGGRSCKCARVRGCVIVIISSVIVIVINNCPGQRVRRRYCLCCRRLVVIIVKMLIMSIILNMIIRSVGSISTGCSEVATRVQAIFIIHDT